MALAQATGPHQLVVQTSFLGDTVLTTPLIAELARRGPVDVVVTPASAPLLARNPDIHELFVYDKRGADAGQQLKVLEIRREVDRTACSLACSPSDRSPTWGASRTGCTSGTGRWWSI